MKNKKFLGMPIPDRKLSPEELRSFSEGDFQKLGIETRFWPWYFQACWGFARLVIILYLVVAVTGSGISLLSGETFDYLSLTRKFSGLMMLALAFPVIVLIISSLWWYGPMVVDKLRECFRR